MHCDASAAVVSAADQPSLILGPDNCGAEVTVQIANDIL
jgi:hypothetical protein